MPFDFDTVVDRTHSSSIKWDWYPTNVIPMWVADMDFKTPDAILRAMSERIAHGVFGYEMPSKQLRQVIMDWCARQYGWVIQPQDIIFLPGLVNGLNLMSRIYGQLGDSALMLTPVYPPFLTAPINNGMQAVKVLLTRVDTGDTFDYDIDFDALEKAITPRTRMFIHCHPHNPVGKEFTKEQNTRLSELCIKHGLLLISDEIHCDLMLGGTQHTPVAALSPEIGNNTITLMAPSKTFNIPGLKSSFAIVQNPHLRKQLENQDHALIASINNLGLAATQAAYADCDDWLAALLGYLTTNRDTMLDFVAENLPGVRTTVPNSTYLGWLDCTHAGIKDNENPYQFFLREAKVALSDGAIFGPGGEPFVRFNFGCPRPQMMQALERMADALHTVKM